MACTHSTAIVRPTNKNAMFMLFLTMELNKITALRLAPTLPMNRAMTASHPVLIATNAVLIINLFKVKWQLTLGFLLRSMYLAKTVG